MPLFKPCLLAETGRLKFNRRFILFAIFVAAPLGLFAQAFTPDPDWRFDNFNGLNHFESRNINGVTMDKHGYIWVCSRGIQRFDGFSTIDYNSLNPSKSGLKDNYTDLISDGGGRIWVSSGGLCYYDEIKGKFIYPDPGPKHAMTYAFALSIQKKYLWFVCDYGLAKLNLDSLTISYTSLTKIQNPLCSYPLNDSTLLISSRQQLYSYNIKKNSFAQKTVVLNHSVVKVFAIKKCRRSVFLATTLGLFNYKSLDDISLCPATRGITINDISFMPQDKDEEHLFLATDGKGLLVYNTISKKIELSFLHDNNNPYGLPSNEISRFYTDKNGWVWLATGAGVSTIDFVNQRWKTRFLNYNNTDEISINKIERDKYDSTKVWMSCLNRGLLCINWKTKQIQKTYNISAEATRILSFEQLTKTRWLLVTQKKIMEWDSNAGVLLSKRLPVADSLSLAYGIRGIVMAGDNRAFITSDRGLFRYDLALHLISAIPNAVMPDDAKEPLKYDLVSGLLQDGKVWAASRDGLFCYDVSSGDVTLYSGPGPERDYYFFDITAIGGNQFAFASANGLVMFNKQTNTFSVFNTVDNLYRPVCISIIYKNNLLWIGTEAGILNYNQQTRVFSNFGHETAVDQAFPASPFAIIGTDIVFGIRNGFVYFTSGNISDPVPSDPVIEAVYVNNQPVLPYYPSQNNKAGFDFNHTENSVKIAFTAFMFSNPDDIKFRYRLKGADSKWQYTDDQRSANYAQLEPGEYTFYLQSGGKHSHWSVRPASFSFIIEPPYWETWWFRAIVILLIGLGLYSLYRYRINNILAIQKIRERIASDFHDDIGSALSSISIFSDIADTQLEEKLPHEETREVVGHITTHARAMLEAMDDIVWAVNPRNDHFNDLAVRMREFCIPLLEAKNIHFEIDIDESILNTRLKMEARKNIFLIFKECVNNLLKHSGCTDMRVSVAKSDTYFEIIISDNGKGFDLSAPSNRNGLKNMQKRAAEINGSLKVTTRPGAGVTTRLVIDMT